MKRFNLNLDKIKTVLSVLAFIFFGLCSICLMNVSIFLLYNLGGCYAQIIVALIISLIPLLCCLLIIILTVFANNNKNEEGEKSKCQISKETKK